LGALPRGGEQRRLAHAGLADELECPAVPGARRGEEGLQPAELRLASVQHRGPDATGSAALELGDLPVPWDRGGRTVGRCRNSPDRRTEASPPRSRSARRSAARPTPP